ncbi:prepilin-type N-terminal cleavage/methylation domain-containing protein [Uliginosibacterium sp. H1]|uniref:prepilin-type N-terminal cleavage/methylation domain-containing protein n=1 Tax=Uliginosibacterium sp. H1 TaxID=3114757 RepID=UPI002E184BE7|nr:prepilin-type N-terminal cleavage/methylation domain-containing protein [Uliginosibacterium sp. H1]
MYRTPIKPEPRAKHQTGVTLVELMVTMVVAILVLLAATSGAALFERSRRATIGNNSALENGIAVAFDIQREVQSAGLWGVNGPCPSIWTYNAGGSSGSGAWETAVATSTEGHIGPPAIITAASITDEATSDSITVNGLSRLVGVPTTLTHPATTTTLKVQSTSEIIVGDVLAIAPPSGTAGECFLGKVTTIAGSDVTIAALQAGATPNYNYAANSLVYSFGPVRSALYRVVNGNFETVNLVSDPDGDPDRNGSTTVIAENALILRAQYGISATPADLGISKWVNPGNAEATANRLRAIRIAVVTRSPQASLQNTDTGASTGACLTTTVNPALPWTSVTGVDDTARGLNVGVASPGEARCFEYRTSTITIPLKNYLFTGGGA